MSVWRALAVVGASVSAGEYASFAREPQLVHGRFIGECPFVTINLSGLQVLMPLVAAEELRNDLDLTITTLRVMHRVGMERN